MTSAPENETGMRFLERPEHKGAILLGAVAVMVGLGAAAWVSWTCDDAFISYRYARHLVDGEGLVFNPGERVEGYTNLLWTLWIAVGMAIHVDPETWTALFGLLSYGSVLVLALAFHAELRRRLAVSRWTVPAACLALALHPDAHVFATSGLETAAFTATAFAGYFVVVRGLVIRAVNPVLSGVLFGLCLMLRPDGVIFAAMAGAALFVWSSRRLRDVGLFALTAGLFWAGTTAFRVAYYGDYFPNTYYAKSANLTWHSQGLAYLVSYLHKYWVYLAGAVLFTASRRALLLRGADDDAARFERIHGALSLACVVLYSYYVVRVGGDFMYARLLVPTAPYLAILFELSLVRVSLLRPVLYAELVAAALLIVLFTPRPTTANAWFSGIADERAYYDDKLVVQRSGQAAFLAEFLQGLPVTVAFIGTEARLVYEARIPVAIESETGLTDRTIAHQPLLARGRVGHEKRAHVPYLVETRKANFTFAKAATELLDVGKFVPLRTIQMGPVGGYILHWDPVLLAELRRRGAAFEDFPAYLDHYLQDAGSLSRAEVASDYAKFRRFYFMHVADPAREAPFERLLAPEGRLPQ